MFIDLSRIPTSILEAELARRRELKFALEQQMLDIDVETEEPVKKGPGVKSTKPVPKTLQQAVRLVLKDGPLQIQEIANRIRSTGYKTNAKDIKANVQTVIGRDKGLKRVSTGVYRLRRQ